MTWSGRCSVSARRPTVKLERPRAMEHREHQAEEPVVNLGLSRESTAKSRQQEAPSGAHHSRMASMCVDDEGSSPCVALIRSQSLFIEDLPHFLRRDGHINMPYAQVSQSINDRIDNCLR